MLCGEGSRGGSCAECGCPHTGISQATEGTEMLHMEKCKEIMNYWNYAYLTPGCRHTKLYMFDCCCTEHI
jgi:hypothetical protein